MSKTRQRIQGDYDHRQVYPDIAHQNKFISCEQTVNLATTKDNIENGHLFYSHLTVNNLKLKDVFR